MDLGKCCWGKQASMQSVDCSKVSVGARWYVETRVEAECSPLGLWIPKPTCCRKHRRTAPPSLLQGPKGHAANTRATTAKPRRAWLQTTQNMNRVRSSTTVSRDVFAGPTRCKAQYTMNLGIVDLEDFTTLCDFEPMPCHSRPRSDFVKPCATHV